MNKLVSSIAHGVLDFTNKSLIKNLIIITLCIMFFFVQIFYPYQFYAAAQRADKPFEVGVHYVYEQDDEYQIYDQVRRIHDLGITTIRVTLECDTYEYSHMQNRKTDVFYRAVDDFGMKVALVIKNLDDTVKVDYYLSRWGGHLSYIQVFNEPELSSTWSIGAVFTDDEILSKFDIMYNTVEAHHLSAQLYTNFGIGYVLRSNVPMELSKKLDFVGLDIFMDSFLVLSPHFVKNLQTITNRDVVITEFGMSTSSDQAQTDYILKGLNLYKSMGLTACWLVYWNSQGDNYGIRDRPTEQAIGEWIANNA